MTHGAKAAEQRLAMIRSIGERSVEPYFATARHARRIPLATHHCRDLREAYIAPVTNIPHLEEIEAVKRAFPEASKALDCWRAGWLAAVAEMPFLATSIADPKTEHNLPYRTEQQWSAWRGRAAAEILKGLSPVAGMRRLVDTDEYLRNYRNGHRNLLHHYVDDAYTFLSLAQAVPGMAVLFTPIAGCVLLYAGLGPDGLPRFTELKRHERYLFVQHVKDNLEDDAPYWTWKPVVAAMRRELHIARDIEDASGILLDMASRGHDRAFLKGMRSKSGTWTVDLRGATTLEETCRRAVLHGHDSSCGFSEGILVQEHLPTTREQRFFVSDGKVVASVCSDRNMNGTDAVRGRILDERVSVIRRPEIECGEFDRGETSHAVDRPLAAAFAIEARRIARELRGEGKTQYVIDMGLTSRGVVAVEINSFLRSGPYCLDHDLLAAAHRRRLTAEQIETAAANIREGDVTPRAAPLSPMIRPVACRRAFRAGLNPTEK